MSCFKLIINGPGGKMLRREYAASPAQGVAAWKRLLAEPPEEMPAALQAAWGNRIFLKARFDFDEDRPAVSDAEMEEIFLKAAGGAE